MIDNCIVTKLELSEREKEMRRAFLQKSNGSKDIQAKSKSREKNTVPSSQEQEMINKLIVESGINERPKVRNNFPTTNSIPFNLIYSQNKILERNVDVLHETQRSLHDLIVYNIKHDKPKKSKHKESHLKEIKELIQPLCSNYEEIKTSLNNLITKQNDLKDEKLASKVEDMLSKHSEFKENSTRIQKSIQLAEKNKSEDKTMLNAITELKHSIKGINEEVGKIENEFNNKFKRIIETIENKKLTELLGQSSMSNRTIQSRMNSNADTSVSSMNYAEYRNEIYDISHRKDEILSEFKKNKLIIPQPFSVSKEKVRFSYNLDDDVINFSNQFIKSGADTPFNKINDRSMNMSLTKDKNIFLNNMQNKSTQKKPEQRENHLHKVESKLKLNKSEEHSISNSKSPERKEEENESIDVIEKMKRFKERMENANNKLKEESKNHPHPVSINVNHSTKNSVQSTEPSSSKFFKSPKITETINKKLSVIPDEEVNEIKYAVYEINSKTDNNLRKEIKEIDVIPKEKQKKQILDEVVLKLCVDKMLQGKTQRNIPIPLSKEEILPFNITDNHLRDIVIKLVIEYIRNLLKKSKMNKQKEQNTSGVPVNEINKQEEKKNKTDHLMNMMETLIDKINNINPSEGRTDFTHLEHIVERITDKMRSGMNINIHLPNAGQQIIPQASYENQLEHHSLQLESKRQESVVEDQPSKDEEYSHPFSNRHQVDQQALEREIQMPYMINLNEYEISSSSSYVTETHRTINMDKGINTDIVNESYSHGQVLNESIDSSQITGKDRTHFDLLMLKTFNEKLKGHLTHYHNKQVEEDVTSSVSQVGSSQNSQNEEMTSENLTSSGSQKQYVDINNKEQLKTMDLYDSNEYNMFKKQFNQSEENVQIPSPNENVLKFYKPSQSGAPLILSFGNNNNITSNRSNTNEDRVGNRMSFTKISNEEIDNLIKRQNNLNDRLKLLGQGNNTISENNSEINNTTIQQGDGGLKQSSEIEKRYKTDESSEFY